MSTTPSDIENTPFGAPPRPLVEDVLQSAEEAVLSNPASVETLQGGEPVPAAEGDGDSRSPLTDRLARQVADRPLQSALLAMAAGAAVTMLLKSALAGRRRVASDDNF